MTDPGSIADAAPDRLERAGAPALAYHRSPGGGPWTVFLGGFMSDMTGTKATALEVFCRERGRAYLRFDYRGHGASEGAFADGTIGLWTEDALAAIDALTDGPVVLVGSSMGGWIMLNAALERPERVVGLLGIAAAPDFTERMMNEEFDAPTRAALMRDGLVRVPSDYGDEPYAITRALIEDGRRHLLLGAPIPIRCPVRLIQGMADTAVPWRTALAIAERLESRDVEVTLVKSADHRLSDPPDLDRLCLTLKALWARVAR